MEICHLNGPCYVWSDIETLAIHFCHTNNLADHLVLGCEICVNTKVTWINFTQTLNSDGLRVNRLSDFRCRLGASIAISSDNHHQSQDLCNLKPLGWDCWPNCFFFGLEETSLTSLPLFDKTWWAPPTLTWRWGTWWCHGRHAGKEAKTGLLGCVLM